MKIPHASAVTASDRPPLSRETIAMIDADDDGPDSDPYPSLRPCAVATVAAEAARPEPPPVTRRDGPPASSAPPPCGGPHDDGLRPLPTWLWEQLALAALLAVGVWRQVAPMIVPLAPPVVLARAALQSFAWAFVLFAGHKVRSMADRQRERDEAAGVEHAPMGCAHRVAFWSQAAAWAGLAGGLAFAATWAHAAVALFVGLYGPARRLYRSARPYGRPS